MTNIDEQPENNISDDVEGQESEDAASREAVSDGHGHELPGDDDARAKGDTMLGGATEVRATNFIRLSSDLHI
jgi:hypothetical protein